MLYVIRFTETALIQTQSYGEAFPYAGKDKWAHFCNVPEKCIKKNVEGATLHGPTEARSTTVY